VGSIKPRVRLDQDTFCVWPHFFEKLGNLVWGIIIP
jgi:hypothetical protein